MQHPLSSRSGANLAMATGRLWYRGPWEDSGVQRRAAKDSAQGWHRVSSGLTTYLKLKGCDGDALSNPRRQYKGVVDEGDQGKRQEDSDGQRCPGAWR